MKDLNETNTKSIGVDMYVLNSRQLEEKRFNFIGKISFKSWVLRLLLINQRLKKQKLLKLFFWNNTNLETNLSNLIGISPPPQ